LTTIRCEADLAAGLSFLLTCDPRLCPIADACGPLPLRLSPPGFAGLASIIVSQMVSRASADAIWRRMTAVLGNRPLAEDYLALGPELIGTFGLSRGKAQALEEAAKADLGGPFRLDELAEMPAETAIAALTGLKGIGPWTAEVYLMFCGGHPDIFPVGDVALRISVGDVFFAGERPAPELVAELAEAWAPVRSVAARLFWAHYALITGRTALPR
jgi:DNA-3-methyladenine glycosylase II